MIEWFSQHGVELAAFVFTLIVTIVGWALEHRSSKEQNRERKDDIRFLREQLDSLQRQATTLEEQTAMQRADHDRPPFSDAEWVRGSIRRVRIEGSRPVHVESAAPKKDTYLFQLKNAIARRLRAIRDHRVRHQRPRPGRVPVAMGRRAEYAVAQGAQSGV